MNRYLPGRRDFLMTMTALGAAGLPAVAAASRLRSMDSADAAAGAPAAAYNPAAKLDITVKDVEFRKTKAGRQLMARV
jgi:hypothetical protein